MTQKASEALCRCEARIVDSTDKLRDLVVLQQTFGDAEAIRRLAAVIDQLEGVLRDVRSVRLSDLEETRPTWPRPV